MAGVEGIDSARGLRLNVADHALDAASEGMGVVLAYKVVAAGDIVAGRLVSPFGPEMPVPGRSYYFVCAKGQEKRAAVKAFRDWVFAEIAETHAALGAALVGPSAKVRPRARPGRRVVGSSLDR
jgi:LysR family glycine cleavage system transcriptional activator